MVQKLNKEMNYRSYIPNVLRMYVFMDAGMFDTDEADVVREEMVEPWYALSQEERKRMDGLVMDLNELRKCRQSNFPAPPMTEKHQQEGLVRIREVYELKKAGKYDEALEHLRKWQSVIMPQFVWHFRGDCWNDMDVPEVAVEFHREATRLDPNNDQFSPGSK